MPREFKPNHNVGLISFSLINGLSSISTRMKQMQRAVPEMPEVRKAKETDQRFLLQRSP